MYGTHFILLSFILSLTCVYLICPSTDHVIWDCSVLTVTITHSPTLYPLPCFYLRYLPSNKLRLFQYSIKFVLPIKLCYCLYAWSAIPILTIDLKLENRMIKLFLLQIFILPNIRRYCIVVDLILLPFIYICL